MKQNLVTLLKEYAANPLYTKEACNQLMVNAAEKLEEINNILDEMPTLHDSTMKNVFWRSKVMVWQCDALKNLDFVKFLTKDQ